MYVQMFPFTDSPSPHIKNKVFLSPHSSLQTYSYILTKKTSSHLNIFLEEVVQDHFINCWAQPHCACWNVRSNGLMKKENKIRRILLCSFKRWQQISTNWARKLQNSFFSARVFSWRAKLSRDARKSREPAVLSFLIFFSEENRNIPPTGVSLQTYTLHLPKVSCHHLRLSDTVCKITNKCI